MSHDVQLAHVIFIPPLGLTLAQCPLDLVSILDPVGISKRSRLVYCRLEARPNTPTLQYRPSLQQCESSALLRNLGPWGVINVPRVTASCSLSPVVHYLIREP